MHAACERCGAQAVRIWQIDPAACMASTKCLACQHVMTASWGEAQEASPSREGIGREDVQGEKGAPGSAEVSGPASKQKLQAYLYAGVVAVLVLAIILVMVW